MKNNFIKKCGKSVIYGICFGIGVIASTVIAISITAAFNDGDTLTASGLNELKSAIESLPGWNLTETAAPTVDDDSTAGYSVGSVWVDTSGKNAYMLVDATPSKAEWKNLTKISYAVGDRGPAGGIVISTSDNGFHGLEAAPADLTTLYTWNGACGDSNITGADATDDGEQNTSDIISECGGLGTAAEAAVDYYDSDDYTLKDYDDWFLPSVQELELMYQLKEDLGVSTSTYYWSSTELDDTKAWVVTFISGGSITASKGASFRVRPIRSF